MLRSLSFENHKLINWNGEIGQLRLRVDFRVASGLSTRSSVSCFCTYKPTANISLLPQYPRIYLKQTPPISPLHQQSELSTRYPTWGSREIIGPSGLGSSVDRKIPRVGSHLERVVGRGMKKSIFASPRIYLSIAFPQSSDVPLRNMCSSEGKNSASL